MADQDTMTILVKVRDEATRALASLRGRIASAFIAPLNAVSRTMRGIVKQFFDLRKLLVGGGILAIVGRMTKDLAKNAKEYEAVFSAETQAKIDDTASALNKLGASLKSTIGEIVADLDLASVLNGMSDWLRDNKSSVVEGFRAIGDAIGYIAEVSKSTVKVLDEALYKAIMKVGEVVWGPKGLFPPTPDPAREDIFTTPGPGGGPGVPVESLQQAANLDWSGMAKAAKIINDVKAQSDGAGASLAKMPEIVREVTKAVEQQAPAVREVKAVLAEYVEIIEGYLSVGDLAAVVSHDMTDAFFEVIQGTKSVARAFADMVSSISSDIARLLIQRAIFQAILSIAGTGGATAGAAGIGGGVGADGPGAFGPGFEPPAGYPQPTGRAMGGRASGVVTVGERGPERVFLPRGSRVESSHRGGGSGGGITVYVNGARDPMATSREVVAAIKRDPVLRASLRA